MIISAHTKIAALLNHHPDTLEAIVSISPAFTKLRNKVLRKVIAGRTSIAMACRIGGCTVDDFLRKLQPLGFEVNTKALAADDNIVKKPVPEWLRNIDPANIIDLDVRTVIDKGRDPLHLIMDKVKLLQAGQVLRIVNSFEPTPLMHLLGKQGFQSFAEQVNEELVFTYFYKETGTPLAIKEKITCNHGDWGELLNRFTDKLVTIDVRGLEMPLPMHTILESLATLPAGKALYVYHKRIPVFLLPELEEQKFSYRIQEICDTEVHLLIYKD